MTDSDSKEAKTSKKKPDALSGRFAVTEELEAWAAEQKARRARGDGSRFETGERSPSTGMVFIPARAVSETLGPVALRPADYELEATGFRMGAGIHQLIFPFKTLVSVEATDPYPTFEVEWRHMGGQTRRRFVPRFAKDQEAWAQTTEALFAHLEARFPHVVARGWLDAPVVEWQRVAAFPDERPPGGEDRGGYRMSAREQPTEEIVAARGAPKALEAMMDWLASSPESPWREHPREVKVTAHHVYVRRRDDAVYRLPHGTLRTALTNENGDVVYIFGRATRMLLPHREGCPVTTALGALL